MKKQTWVIVANSANAHVYVVERPSVLKELKSFENKEAHLHTRDITTDKPGRAFSSAGRPGGAQGRHGLETAVDPKQQEAINFAKEIAAFLEEGRVKGFLNRFYLVASPSFLGLLRQEIDHHTLQLMEADIDKDITHMSPKEIQEYLPFNLV